MTVLSNALMTTPAHFLRASLLAVRSFTVRRPLGAELIITSLSLLQASPTAVKLKIPWAKGTTR